MYFICLSHPSQHLGMFRHKILQTTKDYHDFIICLFIKKKKIAQVFAQKDYSFVADSSNRNLLLISQDYEFFIFLHIRALFFFNGDSTIIDSST